MNKQERTIKCDAGRLLGNIGSFFDDNRWITELAQNSYRAGATHITVRAVDTLLLEFEDNGKGITESGWDNLFGLATSDWDESVETHQRPAGLGALALASKLPAQWRSGTFVARTTPQGVKEGNYTLEEQHATAPIQGLRVSINLEGLVEQELRRIAIQVSDLKSWLGCMIYSRQYLPDGSLVPMACSVDLESWKTPEIFKGVRYFGGCVKWRGPVVEAPFADSKFAISRDSHDHVGAVDYDWGFIQFYTESVEYAVDISPKLPVLGLQIYQPNDTHINFHGVVAKAPSLNLKHITLQREDPFTGDVANEIRAVCRYLPKLADDVHMAVSVWGNSPAPFNMKLPDRNCVLEDAAWVKFINKVVLPALWDRVLKPRVDQFTALYPYPPVVRDLHERFGYSRPGTDFGLPYGGNDGQELRRTIPEFPDNPEDYIAFSLNGNPPRPKFVNTVAGDTLLDHLASRMPFVSSEALLRAFGSAIKGKHVYYTNNFSEVVPEGSYLHSKINVTDYQRLHANAVKMAEVDLVVTVANDHPDIPHIPDFGFPFPLTIVHVHVELKVGNKTFPVNSPWVTTLVYGDYDPNYEDFLYPDDCCEEMVMVVNTAAAKILQGRSEEAWGLIERAYMDLIDPYDLPVDEDTGEIYTERKLATMLRDNSPAAPYLVQTGFENLENYVLGLLCMFGAGKLAGKPVNGSFQAYVTRVHSIRFDPLSHGHATELDVEVTTYQEEDIPGEYLSRFSVCYVNKRRGKRVLKTTRRIHAGSGMSPEVVSTVIDYLDPET